MRRTTRGTRFSALVAAVLLAAAAPAVLSGSAGAQPTTDPYLSLILPSGIFGSNWPDGETVVVEIDDPATALSPDYSDVSGVVGQPCPPAPCSSGNFALGADPYVIKAGDLVSAEVVGDPSVSASYVVQQLSVDDVNFAADTVTGTAAPGTQVVVLAGSNRFPVADGAGNWVADFTVPGPSGEPVYDLTPADDIIVWVNPGSGPPHQTVIGVWDAPDLAVFPATSTGFGDQPFGFVFGSFGWPDGETVAVEIDDPATPADPDFSAFSGVVGEPCPPPGTCGPGNFGIDTAPYVVKAGDVVTAEVVGDPLTAGAHMVQPLSVTDVDFAADTVTGTAAPWSRLGVRFFGGTVDESRQPTADGGGDWVADFSSPDPTSGDPPYDLVESGSITVVASPPYGPGVTVIAAWQALPPSITVAPDAALVDGQAVTVEGDGWLPGIGVGIAQCAPDRFSFDDCVLLLDEASTTVGPDGTFVASVVVQEVIATNNGPVDCKLGGCDIWAVHLTGAASFGGPVRIHFASPPEPPVVVHVDVKPGSDPNSINTKSGGVIPVAILTTDDFDATTVDPATVQFAGAAPLRWAYEDVDLDGDIDLVLKYRTQETALAVGDTEACVEGMTIQGVPIHGCDSIRVRH